MTVRGQSAATDPRVVRRRRRRALPRLMVVGVSAGTIAVAVAAGVGVVPGVGEISTRVVAADQLPAAQADGALGQRRPEGRDRPSRAARPTKPIPTSDGSSVPTPPALTTPWHGPPEERDDTPTPEPTKIPESASGDLTVIDGTAPGDESAARVITYRIEVEGGLPFDHAEVADVIHAVLSDEKGWPGVHDVSFARTDSGDADLRIIVASPDLTDSLCRPLDTRGEVSCKIDDRVVLNAKRWAFGVDHFDDLDEYRTYLVNHEVGHALGYGHVGCPGKGEPAPVMMQQTKGIGACTTNPWPTVAYD